jgi:hypothetical protein
MVTGIHTLITNIQQERQCPHVPVNTVAMKPQQCVLRIVELHVTANKIKIPTVAQECFYGEFMSQAAIKLT